jgi:zinc D-Ala-D-Ala carboxypeptidase
MNLSPNFTLEELTVSEIAARRNLDNTPNATEVANLVRVAELLDPRTGPYSQTSGAGLH